MLGERPEVPLAGAICGGRACIVGHRIRVQVRYRTGVLYRRGVGLLRGRIKPYDPPQAVLRWQVSAEGSGVSLCRRSSSLRGQGRAGKTALPTRGLARPQRRLGGGYPGRQRGPVPTGKADRWTEHRRRLLRRGRGPTRELRRRVQLHRDSPHDRPGRSWCQRIRGTTSVIDCSASIILTPSRGCCLTTAYSSGVSAAGLLRMASGMLILPMSCNRPPRKSRS